MAIFREFGVESISGADSPETGYEVFTSIIQVFGDVFTTDEMIQLIETSAAGEAISSAAE